MKADYESQADTIQITLGDGVRRLSRNDLDAEALIAISRAAVAAPDRPVRLDVGARIAV